MIGRKRYTPEQIIGMVRESEVTMTQGQTVYELCPFARCTSLLCFYFRLVNSEQKMDQTFLQLTALSRNL